jgi:hypothetical protein
MTTSPSSSTRRIQAHVHVVLPRFGLAYAQDDARTLWGLSRSVQGPDLDTLEPGQALSLEVEQCGAFGLVSRYERAD